jgi:hypothetical protein
MARRNGALELFSLVRFSCRVYRTHTSPLVSVCVCVCLSLSLSLSLALLPWSFVGICAQRVQSVWELYLGVFFLFILGEEFRVFSRCVDWWCIRNRVPRKWTRGTGIGCRGSSNTFSLVCPCASLLNPDKELNLLLAGRTSKLFCNKGTAVF